MNLNNLKTLAARQYTVAQILAAEIVGRVTEAGDFSPEEIMANAYEMLHYEYLDFPDDIRSDVLDILAEATHVPPVHN